MGIRSFFNRRKIKKNPKYCYECVKKIDHLHHYSAVNENKHFCSFKCLIENVHKAIKPMWRNW